MKKILSAIYLSSLLLANLSHLPQATAQCLTKNDDMSNVPASTDLSGILDFNLQLFREMLPTDMKTNFIFSSYSIWNALTLAYFGASGKTEEQLRHVLHLDDKITTLQKWRALEFMYKNRPETSVNNTFILANRAYFDKKIQLRSCMEDILHTEIEKIDFTKANEAADYINTFVSETTKGTIQKLVTSEDINGANLVLVNAAYFKGAWQYIFDKVHTEPHPFTGLDNTHYIVDMMEQRGDFRYVYDDEIKAEVLELPYSGETISMMFFKPLINGQSGFNSMVQQLSMSKYEGIVAKMQPTQKIVRIPKFRLDTTCGNDLIEALSRMGLTDPFSGSKADFTSFTLERHISLDKSIHKAFIVVNEEGTEAAAATAFIDLRSRVPNGFECDRPFVFAIRDRKTNNLLFMGAYKSSDKIDRSYKPGGSDGNNILPDISGNVNPSIFIPGKDGEIIPPHLGGNENPKPVTPIQEGSNFDFSHDLFPTPGPPVRGSSQNSGQSSPSIGNNGGSSSGRESNQNTDRNTLDNNDFIPRRVSDQNIDRLIPSSVRNNEFIPDRNPNPNLNNQPSANRGDSRTFNSERRNA